jgi:hypothetical protein
VPKPPIEAVHQPQRAVPKPPVEASDPDVEDLMNLPSSELQRVLEQMRKRDLEIAAEKLKVTMSHQGRCIVCTLKPPCKHFESSSQVPKLPPIDIPEKTFVTSVSTLKDSIRSFSQSPQRNPNMTIRYRKIGHDTSIQESKLSELRVAESQLKLQRKAEERLKQLERIEAYREERLRKEIERIEIEKRREREEAESKKKKEYQRLKYLETQREKLLEYEAKRREISEQKETAAYKSREAERREELRRKRYFSENKRQITNYNAKKRLIEGILRDQVEDLEVEVLKKGGDSLSFIGN